MGTYNSAVITNGGQSMIAQAVAGTSLEFTTIKTSSYAYPAGTNLATLTTISGIKQSKDITGAAVYNSRVIKISTAVDNTGISTAYTINTIGIYAKVGSSAESLFAVVTASAADTMPAYDSRPYSYIYEINLTMQNAANVTVTVNAAGLVNVADLNAAKVEIQGEIADLKSALNASGFLKFNKGHYYRTPSIGVTLDNPPTANTSNSVDGIAIECVRGQVFVLYGTPYSNSGIRPCCFTDENRQVRYKLDTTEALNGYIVVAPFDGWALFNFRNDTPHYVYTSDSVISKSLEPHFNNIESIPQHYGYIPLKKNKYVNTPAVGETITPVYNSSLQMSTSSVYLQCTKGQKFILSGKPTDSPNIAPYLFADGNNTVVYREPAVSGASAYVNKVIEAPVDGTIVINFSHTYNGNDVECFVYTPSADVSALLNYVLADVVNEITEYMPSTNIFDGDVTQGHYINTSGVIGNSSSLCYTNTYYPVKENDKFIAGTGENTRAQLRYVTAYDENKNVLSTKGMNGGYLYTTPGGVAFVRFSFYLTDVQASDFRLNKSAFLLPYEPYNPQVVPKGYDSLEKVLNSPLSTLPDYIINSLAYKPLGTLSKPYICLVSDDGDEDMITYSIPMVESKGVPCTWAIMSTSEMFNTANVETNVATVLDSVNNHGCAISQHGGTNWTEYTEKDLNEFFEREKVFLASYGLTAKSAVIPSHYTSPLVCAVAGGKYGVCRSGLNGQDAHGNTYEEIMKPYPHYTCGARTNIYCLSSQNISHISQAEAQTVINYINTNNGIAIFYWHENSLDSTLKQRIEDAIDYGLSLGIDFITLDQIKTVI